MRAVKLNVGIASGHALALITGEAETLEVPAYIA